MTDLQWFAFVYLPIGVGVFGVAMAVVGRRLIDAADHYHHKPAE